MIDERTRRREDRFPMRVWIWLRRIFVTLGIVTALLLYALASVVSHGERQASMPDKFVLALALKPGFAAETRGAPALDQSLFKPAPTLRDVLDGLAAAAKDPRVKGVTAKLERTGLSLAQVQELRAAIKAFRKSGKFAWIYADSYSSGMGGYYLATAFDKVWMQPVGAVAITGIAAEVPFGKDLFDKIGVNPQFSHKGTYKSFPESLTRTGMSDANREMTESLIADLSRQIVADIAESRGLKPEELRAKIDSAPYGDQEALKEKLVDRLGYADELRDEAEKLAGIDDKGFIGLADYNTDRKGGASALLRGDQKGKPKVALITGSGEISATSQGGSGMGADKISAAFRKAEEDKDVAAVVFRIDSPGGSPEAAETMRRAVVQMKKKGRPVIVSMGGMAASGGYWAAAAADKIVADPGTLTGSIGVFGGKIELSGLWKKIGVNWDSVAEGKNARMWSTNRPFSPDELARFESLLSGIYDGFIARVAEGRHMPADKVEAVAEGRVWTGAQAKERGLVDELGGIEQAIALAKKTAKLPDDAPVAEFPPRRSGIEVLAEMVTGDDSALSLLPLNIDAGDLARLADQARENSILKMPDVAIH
jgi:protease-4